jgi:hypothetical protein
MITELMQLHDTVLLPMTLRISRVIITTFHHGFPFLSNHAIPHGTAYGWRQAQHVQQPLPVVAGTCRCETCYFFYSLIFD